MPLVSKTILNLTGESSAAVGISETLHCGENVTAAGSFWSDTGTTSLFSTGCRHDQRLDVCSSIRDWVQRRAEFAEKFLNSPISAVLRWAEGEIEFSSYHADDFRQNEAERC
jgi:hypothetical protein